MASKKITELGTASSITGTELTVVVQDGVTKHASVGEFGNISIANTVYLVPESDVNRMGGAANRVYSTFQAAYDAANTLQLSLAAGTRVLIISYCSAGSSSDLTLSEPWNQYVCLGGYGVMVSSFGSITGSIINNINSLCAQNCSIGNVISEGGISLTQCNNMLVNGFLNTSSSSGPSGDISITISSSVRINSTNQNTNFGNIGTFSIINCSNINVNNQISAVNGSSSDSYNIGALTIANSHSIRLGSYVATLNYASGTGVIAGFDIRSDCSDISFRSTVTLKCVSANTYSPSDSYIESFVVHNTSFAGEVLLNAHSNVDARHGGYINTIIMNNCFLGGGIRIASYTTTHIEGLLLNIKDCSIAATLSNKGIYVLIDNVTYAGFLIINVNQYVVVGVSNDNVIFFGNLMISDVPSIDNIKAQIVNCNVNTISNYLIGHSVDPGYYQMSIINCSANKFLLSADNEMRYYIAGCTQKNFDTNGLTLYNECFSIVCGAAYSVPTSPSVINNSSIYFWYGNSGIVPPLIIKGSNFDYINIDTTITITMSAYTSTFDFTLSNSTPFTLTGSAYTSNIKKKNAATNNLTNNNSFFESVA